MNSILVQIVKDLDINHIFFVLSVTHLRSYSNSCTSNSIKVCAIVLVVIKNLIRSITTV